MNTRFFQVIKEEFKCTEANNSYTWSRCDINNSPFLYAKFMSGTYTNEKGQTLTIPSLDGTAAQELPQNTKMRIYETQKLIFDSFTGLSGKYSIHYEGEEWDRIKYIPAGWTLSGGTFKLSDPLKSRNNFKVTFDGKINGEFTLKD